MVKAARKSFDIQRLMADSGLRRQVASTMSAEIPNFTCISDIAAEMADVCFLFRLNMHHAVSAQVDHSVGFVDHGVRVDRNTVLVQREVTEKRLRGNPNNGVPSKTVKNGGDILEKVRKAALLSANVRKLEARVLKVTSMAFTSA